TVATAAPASAVSTAASAPSAAAIAFFARAGFIDGKGSSAMLLAVEGVDGVLRFVVVGHLDKSESLAASGFAIVDDLRRNDLTILTEKLFQLRAVHAVAQVADIQLLTHQRSPSG